ncbi:MAG: ribosomal L7Ae/L30e/S12e/Gadd45 family protein [Lachnospiraceae bacterium]|nr:ribosomal L7Ae/L30e/S12e/Gadd45 family protein [Lachnospiraceae bacterium]
MNRDPVFAMLGLAARGRNLVSGSFSVERSIREGRAKLVLIAEDASEKTKKKYLESCTYKRIRTEVYGLSTDLGHAIGQESRTVVAVLDQSLAETVAKRLEEKRRGDGGDI